jgi:hypothetical protein
MTTTSSRDRTSHPSPSDLLSRAVETGFMATAVNVALAFALSQLLDVSPDFEPLQSGSVLVTTLVSVVVAALAVLVLRTVAPVMGQRVYVGLVVVWTLFTAAAPLLLLGASPAEQPGVSDAAALATIPQAFVIGTAVTVGLLRR